MAIALLTEVVCARCSMTFAFPDDFRKRRENDHRSFYCPNGHGNYWPQKSELEKLREDLAHERTERQHERTRRIAAQDQAQAAERSRAAIKGVLTKTKKRIQNGVCPHCKRHFENVERHMKSQHQKELGK